MSDLIENPIEDRIGRGLSVPEDFRGCSNAEIAGLESRMAIALPKLYKSYLKYRGWSAGGMLKGSDVRFGSLHELTGEALDLARGMNLRLSDDIFVFFAHQGYDYMYFLLSEGDDPKIYRLHEAWDAPRQVLPAFGEYLRWMFGTVTEIPPDDMPSR